MEGGALFNPGFLGGSFLWWVGQIPNDDNWRDNIKPTKFKSPDEVPGWGYRYKVRIIGLHDQDEATLSSDQLPWAQVMYPITAGGGQGGSFQTPAIKQGNFVFGFFLDGQDQQVPVIMGVLGANTQTPKAINKPGAQPFTSLSGHGSATEVTGDKTSDDNLSTVRPSGTNPSGQPTGGNNPNSPPAAGVIPTKESPTSTQQKASADEKIDEVLNQKHALSCPDPKEKSAMKGIQTVIENLQKKIEKFQKSLKEFSDAVSLNIKNATKDIDKAIDDAAQEISKFMKETYGKIQEFITDKYNKALKQLEKISLPFFRLDMFKLKIEGFEKISCLFNKFSDLLKNLLKAGLANALNKQKQQAPSTPTGPDGQVVPPSPQLTSLGSQVVPPLPPQNYYRPVPICTAEELVAGVLGQHVNEMMAVYDSAIGPVISGIQNSLATAGVPVEELQLGSPAKKSISGAISSEAVAAALKSGDLVSSMSSVLAEQLKVNPSLIGTVTSALQSGDIVGGITSLVGLAGKDVQSVSSALSSLSSGDLVGGLSSIAGSFGADPKILSGIGGAFSAIKSGDIGSLTSSIGQLAGVNPKILGAVQKAGSAFASGDIAGLGALGGLNLDIGAAMDFISSITSLFDCDPKPKCSPNDTYTLQSGGSGKPGTENPNSMQVAQATQEKALAQATGGGTLTGAGTAAEAAALQQATTYSTPAGEVGVA